MTNTGGAPGLASSGAIVRPSSASMPSTWNVLPDTKRAIELLGAVRARCTDASVAAAGDDRVERRHLRRVVEELRGLEEVAAARPAAAVVVDLTPTMRSTLRYIG